MTDPERIAQLEALTAKLLEASQKQATVLGKQARIIAAQQGEINRLAGAVGAHQKIIEAAAGGAGSPPAMTLN